MVPTCTTKMTKETGQDTSRAVQRKNNRKPQREKRTENHRRKTNSNKNTAKIVPHSCATSRHTTQFSLGSLAPVLFIAFAVTDRLLSQLLRSRLHTCHTERGTFSGARPSRRGLHDAYLHDNPTVHEHFVAQFPGRKADRVWVVFPNLLLRIERALSNSGIASMYFSCELGEARLRT